MTCLFTDGSTPLIPFLDDVGALAVDGTHRREQSGAIMYRIKRDNGCVHVDTPVVVL